MIAFNRLNTPLETAGIVCILSMVDQKSGVLMISFLSVPEFLIQTIKPLSTKAADRSSLGWLKLEIMCKTTGARTSGCSFTKISPDASGSGPKTLPERRFSEEVLRGRRQPEKGP